MPTFAPTTLTNQSFVWTTSTKGITTLAEAWTDPTGPKDNRSSPVMDILAQGIHPTIKDARRLDNQLTFGYLFVQANKVRFFSSPSVATDGDGGYQVYGNYGQSLTHHTVVSIPKGSFQGYFISLVPKDEALALRIPTSITDPLEADAPIPTPLPQDWEPSQPGADRIHVHLESPSKTPVFAALPTMMPIPVGTTIHPDMDGFDLGAEGDIPDHLTDFNPIIQWMRGAKYLIKYCDGYPIDANDTLFVFGDIEGTDLHTLDLGGTLEVPLTPLLPDSAPAVTIAAAHIIRSAHDATMHFASTRRMETTPPASPPPKQANSNQVEGSPMSVVAEFAKEISKAVQSAQPSLKDRDNTKQASKAINQYRLLLGRIVSVTDGDSGEELRQFQPADLDQGFIEVLEAGTITSASKDYTELVSSAAEYQCASDLSFGHETDFDDVILSIPHVAAIRTFSWAHSPRATGDSTEFLRTLGLDHFAPVQAKSVHYTECRNERDLIHQQEKVEESNKNRLAARSTSLFSAFTLRNISDVKQTLANFKVFLRTALGPSQFNELQPPLIWTTLLEGINLLHKPEPKAWLKRHEEYYGTRMAFGLVQKFQHIFASFVSTARNSTYVKAMAANDPISPKIFDMALLTKEGLYTNLIQCVNQDTIESFKETSSVFKYFTTEDLDDPSTPPTKKAKTSDPIRDNPPIKNPATGGSSGGGNSGAQRSADGNGNSRTKEPTDSKKAKLIVKPGAKTPILETLVKHPTTGQNTRVCRIDATGGSCPYSSKCKNYHLPAKFTSMPKETRTLLAAEVKALGDALTWAPAYYKQG